MTKQGYELKFPDSPSVTPSTTLPLVFQDKAGLLTQLIHLNFASASANMDARKLE